MRAGHYGNLREGKIAPNDLQKLLPRQVRHVQIEQHQGHRMLGEVMRHRPAVAYGDDIAETGPLQGQRGQEESVFLVVHQKDLFSRSAVSPAHVFSRGRSQPLHEEA